MCQPTYACAMNGLYLMGYSAAAICADGNRGDLEPGGL